MVQNTNQSNFPIEDIYKEIGTNYRFFLNWRHGLLAGYLAVLAALSLGFSWIYTSAHYLLWIIFAIGIIISFLFWALEYRNRDLYRTCMNVGEKCESFFQYDIKMYSELNKIQYSKITHSLSIDCFMIISILSMLLAIILFLFGKI